MIKPAVAVLRHPTGPLTGIANRVASELDANDVFRLEGGRIAENTAEQSSACLQGASRLPSGVTGVHRTRHQTPPGLSLRAPRAAPANRAAGRSDPATQACWWRTL
jgi:hypothetical protein